MSHCNWFAIEETEADLGPGLAGTNPQPDSDYQIFGFSRVQVQVQLRFTVTVISEARLVLVLGVEDAVDLRFKESSE